MNPLRHMLALVLLALAAALALTACGEKSEDPNGAAPQPLALTLDSHPNPDHAGIYMAQRLGYFEQAGLDVTIRTPPDPAAPIGQVAAGRADLAISHAPEVLLADRQGLDVVAVAALVDRPLASMIWLRESRIGGIGGLRGKTIATAGIPYQEIFLRSILARAGLTPADVRTVDAGYGLLPALVGGRADALLGAFRNIEGVDLRLRGRNPVVTPVDRLGIPTYDELVLVARRDRLERDPDPIRLFIAALARGTAAAVKSPNATAEAVLEANRSLSPRLARAEVEATLPLLGAPTPAGGDGETAERPYGYMDPAQWGRLIAWMRDNGAISGRPAPARVLTNELLPGQIPE